MPLSLITAMDRNRAIGLNGDMPWGTTMRADLRRFKELTDGHTIIMGRKTFESLPSILPNRYHIVLSTKDAVVRSPFVHFTNDFVTLAEEMRESEDEVFVIGGAEVYEQFLPYVTTIYMTKVQANLQGDTFFPSITGNWDVTKEALQHIDGDRFPSQYITYTRRD